MPHHFALTIHLHDRRYHGASEWPPSPARVFQALVAGAARGRRVPDDARRALTLLEGLAAPIIAVPHARRGQRIAMFVPNNDLDAVEGDPGRVGEIRTKKQVRPWLLDGDAFLYAWPVSDGADASSLVALANGLYQLGRGVDPAWAIGELLDDDGVAARLRDHRGVIHRPGRGDGGLELACPTTNSLASIADRFEASLRRLRPESGGGPTRFVQPPKAHFEMVPYGGEAGSHLFLLQREDEPERSSPWAAWRAVSLVERARGAAVEALRSALPSRAPEIERVLVGRKRDGADAGPIEERVRFVPLPSIGHEHADQAIRRMLVEVPPGPLAEGDVLWALSGRALFDPETGIVENSTLVASGDDEMVARYRTTSRLWRSVTPLALGSAPRRRIAPERQREEAKSATERASEEGLARSAIAQALRHACVNAALVRAHVQREPFDANGTRAERFAEGSRFPKEALWHAELELDRPIPGPLVLGDGRFLGLGLMVPCVEHGILAFAVDSGLNERVDAAGLARALRRAIMARVQAELGPATELPAYFHGHVTDDAPARGHRSTHLAYVVDAPRSRLLVVPPHMLDGFERPRREDAEHLATLSRALDGFTLLRAGVAGVLSLRSVRLDNDDPLLRASRRFASITDYVVTRHAKRLTAADVVIADVRRECERRRISAPDIRVTGVRGLAGLGVVARAELTFARAVLGPLLLGRTRYFGGGLFEPVGG
jgi:CRISPR-associated protein Csb2